MKLTDQLVTFMKDEDGSAAVEYSLCAALIVAVDISVIEGIGQALNAAFTEVLDKID